MSEDRREERDSNPTVPDSDGGESGTDATADDVHDPAGVDSGPGEDPTGLSGQPDAEGFEEAADWSEVDGSRSGSRDTADASGDRPAVDAETHVDATGRTTEPQGGGAGERTPARSGTTDAADGGGHAGAAGTDPADSGGQRGPDEKYCSNCGAVISQQAVVCPECGVEQAQARQAGAQASAGNGSDPGVAALLSAIGFFVPILTGAGQLYNGDVAKGVLFTVIQLLNVALAFVLVGLVTYPVVGVIAIYDAYSSADG